MRKNIVGETFGNIVIIAAGESKKGYNMWVGRCSCGAELKVSYSHLKSGQKSCRQCFYKRNIKHGMCDSREYAAWKDMKRRCYGLKKNHKSYNSYVGVTVCESWLNSFDAFFKDMGVCPSDIHSLDRYPNNKGNYEPSNCRWATPLQQVNNRRNNIIVEYEGEKRLFKELTDAAGIKYKKALKRYRILGWSIEETLKK